MGARYETTNLKVWAAVLAVAFGAAVVVTLVVTLVSTSKPAKAGAFPGTNGKIAFTRFPNGGTEQIFVMNPDGTGQKNISHTSTFEGVGDYSANRRQIAFASTMPGNSEIFKMGATGLLQTRLTVN